MNYLKLYWIYLKRSFVAKMEFRMDFFIGIGGFLIQNLAYILTIFFIVNTVVISRCKGKVKMPATQQSAMNSKAACTSTKSNCCYRQNR